MSETDDLTVRESPRRGADWEYLLAGQLVGTNWTFPGEETDTVANVRHATERAEGGQAEFPAVVLKYAGTNYSVSGFLRRIDPGDVGDVDPADERAERIVEIQEEVSWRNVALHDGSRERELAEEGESEGEGVER